MVDTSNRMSRGLEMSIKGTAYNRAPFPQSGEQHHANKNIRAIHRNRPRHPPQRTNTLRHTHPGRGRTGTG